MSLLSLNSTDATIPIWMLCHFLNHHSNSIIRGRPFQFLLLVVFHLPSHLSNFRFSWLSPKGSSTSFFHAYHSIRFAWFFTTDILTTPRILYPGSSHLMTPNLSLLSNCVSPTSPLVVTANGSPMNVVYAPVLFSLLHPLYYPPLMSSMCLNYLLALFPQVNCLILVLTFSLLLVVLYRTGCPTSKV